MVAMEVKVIQKNFSEQIGERTVLKLEWLVVHNRQFLDGIPQVSEKDDKHFWHELLKGSLHLMCMSSSISKNTFKLRSMSLLAW